MFSQVIEYQFSGKNHFTFLWRFGTIIGLC